MNEETVDLEFQEDVEFEREIVAPKYERTPPEFPTEGPGDGRTWHEFFVQIREAREAGELVVPRMETTITRPAYDIAPADLKRAPSQIRTYLKLALDNEWDVLVRAADSHRSQGYYLSRTHEKYGEPRSDQKPEDRTLWWIVGTKRNVAWFYFSVLQRPKTTEISGRHWMYDFVPDGELKQRIKGEYSEPTSSD